MLATASGDMDEFASAATCFVGGGRLFITGRHHICFGVRDEQDMGRGQGICGL